MFFALNFHYRLFCTNRVQRRIERSYDSELQKAKHGRIDQNKIDAIKSSKYFELDLAYDEEAKMVSDHLLTVARKLFLTVPDFDDKTNWEESQFNGAHFLTVKGQRELRLAIRAERKNRSENVRLWISGLTGLAGAITGLVALLMHKGAK